MRDSSAGYEAVANDYMIRRARGRIGARTVETWVLTLPSGASVLDVGCGGGIPLAEVLLAQGLTVYGIDPSSSMVSALKSRFPSVAVECESIAESALFHRHFDAALAWGVLFLLSADEQAEAIRKVAAALRPGGKFLFTAPAQRCEWDDNLTGLRSRSLGGDEYRAICRAVQLAVVAEDADEGENHYFFAEKRARPGAG